MWSLMNSPESARWITPWRCAYLDPTSSHHILLGGWLMSGQRLLAATALPMVLQAVTEEVPGIVHSLLLDREGRPDAMKSRIFKRFPIPDLKYRTRTVHLSQCYLLPMLSEQELLQCGVKVINLSLRAVHSCFCQGRNGMTEDELAKDRLNAFNRASQKAVVAKCIAIEFVLGALSLVIKEEHCSYPFLPSCVTKKAQSMMHELLEDAKSKGAEEELCRFMRYEKHRRNHRHNVHCSCTAPKPGTLEDEIGCLACWEFLDTHFKEAAEVMYIQQAKKDFKIRNMTVMNAKGKEVIGHCWCVSCVAGRFSWYMWDTLLAWNMFNTAPTFSWNPWTKRGHMQGEQLPLTQRFLHLKQALYDTHTKQRTMRGNDPFSGRVFSDAEFWAKRLRIMDDHASKEKRQLFEDVELVCLLSEMSVDYSIIVTNILIFEVQCSGMKRSRSEAASESGINPLHHLTEMCRAAGGSGISGVVRKHCLEKKGLVKCLFGAINVKASRGHLGVHERVQSSGKIELVKVLPDPTIFVQVADARAAYVIAGACKRILVPRHDKPTHDKPTLDKVVQRSPGLAKKTTKTARSQATSRRA